MAKRFGLLEASTTLVRLIAAALITMAAVATATAAPINDGDLREVPPEVGSKGDGGSGKICRDGEVMIGFSARVGAWMDHIIMVCSPITPDLKWQPRLAEPGWGGSGGGPFQTVTCKDGSVMWRTHIRYTWDQRQVYSVYAGCRDARTGKDTKGIRVAPKDSEGAKQSQYDQSQRCFEDESMAGLEVYSGKHVNAIGMYCRKLKVPDAVGPTPKPIPPKSTVKIVGQIFCTGGAMQLGSGATKLIITIRFRKAANSSQKEFPQIGECAWSDRPIRADEPDTMWVLLSKETLPVIEAARDGGVFLVSVGLTNNQFKVVKVEGANPGLVLERDKAKGGQKLTGREFVKKRLDRNKAGKDGGGGAGFAAEEAPDGPNFTGNWNATTDDDTGYNLSLTQDGDSVTGEYTATDGTVGTIKGTLKGRVLTFNWKQTDGTKGKGKFTLSGNNGSFNGSYSYDGGSGSWNGSRQ